MWFLARTHLSPFSPTSAFAAICVWVTNIFLSAFEIRLLFWKRNRGILTICLNKHTYTMHLIRLTCMHKLKNYVNFRCVIIYLDKIDLKTSDLSYKKIWVSENRGMAVASRGQPLPPHSTGIALQALEMPTWLCCFSMQILCLVVCNQTDLTSVWLISLSSLEDKLEALVCHSILLSPIQVPFLHPSPQQPFYLN